jgi:long-chain acyl-CoA synthetase
MLRMSFEEAAAKGMVVAWHAAHAPNRLAISSGQGDRTFSEVNAQANRLVGVLRGAGLLPGDGVALLCVNRPEFVETVMACQRAGFRLTPVNWHLTAGEVAYIVENCEAKALVADAGLAAAAVQAARAAPDLRIKLALGGPIEGFASYDTLMARESGENVRDPVPGSQMLYTSGTTGHPKGVYRGSAPAASSLFTKMVETAQFNGASDISIVTGPLYHAAPLSLNLLLPLSAGVHTLLMDKWDAEEMLRLVDRHRITHTHVVPTMLNRLLQLAPEIRAKYDVSSLRWVLHGAAPCPVHVKMAALEWLGPVVFEYYGATEGGGVFIEPAEWLNKPGSVGRPTTGVVMQIQDEGGKELPQSEVGTVYFEAPETGRFEYFKAPEKTASVYRGRFYTMGDLGYVDEDGFLFLTGRSAEVIISGGVNIYPAEIDQEVLQHPAVKDVATVGVPNQEWGEEVKTVVQLKQGYEPNEALAKEILDFAATRLAAYKRPRSLDFADDLPRLETGKIVRRTVRDRYWQGEKKI